MPYITYTYNSGTTGTTYNYRVVTYSSPYDDIEEQKRRRKQSIRDKKQLKQDKKDYPLFFVKKGIV